ncbi:hypothetical protein JCM8547_006276 [Rhodosporidiobolus lusitaniae]
MDAVQARINSRIPKSRKDLKPKRSHFFYGLIVVLGWLCPPVAILVRFGIGWDFFLNIILTICGYIPGHGHNFYCQNVRNNATKARTPRWAVRAGLVEVEDKRGGRHQWANRYDERIAGAPSGRYDGDEASIAGSWDGRGEEPARGGRRLNKPKKQHHGLAPWDNVVEDDEVEGGPDGLYRSESRLSVPDRRAPANDPLTSEEFYTVPAQNAPEAPKKKKSFGSGLLKNRSRYEQPFDAIDVPSSRTRASGDYQDEFEREINQGSRPAAANGAGARFDSFEQEGPEDAWATARPTAAGSNGNGYANGSGAAQRLQPQKTGRAEENDGDLFSHNF